MPFTPDQLQRINLADLYPRKYDPFKPNPTAPPTGGPAGNYGMPSPGSLPIDSPVYDILSQMTTPGQRPLVYQQAVNFNVNLVANTAQAISNNQFTCDSMVLNVYSTAANSVFFGYGGGINSTNGIEIRAGIPVLITYENNDREEWELQRVLEAIYALAAYDMAVKYSLPEIPSIVPYRAPRVCFDSSKYWLFATANTAVSAMLFTVPELQ